VTMSKNRNDREFQKFEETSSGETAVRIIPQSVTPRQFRVALIMSNISMQSIEDMIAALPEPDQSIVRTTWEYSTVFERDNTILNNMAANMGLTQQEVDNLFILAEDL